MPKIREEYTVMSITICPTLKRWVSGGESSASAVVESIVRQAWLRSQGEKRARNAYRKTILDPEYSYKPGVQSHLNAIEMAKSLVNELHQTHTGADIKSQRVRHLAYELRQFIKEGVPSDE